MKGLDIVADRVATGGADGKVRVLSIAGAHLSSSGAYTDVVNAVAVGLGGWSVLGMSSVCCG